MNEGALRQNGRSSNTPSSVAFSSPFTSIAAAHNFESFKLGNTGFHLIFLGRSVVNSNPNQTVSQIPVIGSSVVDVYEAKRADENADRRSNPTHDRLVIKTPENTVNSERTPNINENTVTNATENGMSDTEKRTSDKESNLSNARENVPSKNTDRTPQRDMQAGDMRKPTGDSHPESNFKVTGSNGTKESEVKGFSNTDKALDSDNKTISGAEVTRNTNVTTDEGMTKSDGERKSTGNKGGETIISEIRETEGRENTKNDRDVNGNERQIKASDSETKTNNEGESKTINDKERTTNSNDRDKTTKNERDNITNNDRDRTTNNDRPTNINDRDRITNNDRDRLTNSDRDRLKNNGRDSLANNDRDRLTNNDRDRTTNSNNEERITNNNRDSKTLNPTNSLPIDGLDLDAMQQEIRRMALAKIMKDQFDKFKERLARTADNSGGPKPNRNNPIAAPLNTNAPGDLDAGVNNDPSNTGSQSNSNREGRGRSSLQVGELVQKSERRAGEDPSGVRSGILRVENHPIPVTFHSLPGFPSSFPPRAPGTVPGVAQPPAGVGAPTATFPPAGVDTRGNTQTPQVPVMTFPRVPGMVASRPSLLGTSTPARRTQVGDLMRLLQSRLIGGLREATNGMVTPAPTSRPQPQPQQFDPSIVVNFLTLVALSQNRGGGSSSAGQRNAAPVGMSSLPLPSNSPNTGEFGPFSTGNDPSAGVDPSSIMLPPMLRQTLYSYLLPRLASLTALVETVPGVPGLDYPIIANVPYTNFYCSAMPWPGFYADTEARCQVWHYCDLDGRQASFLCPNGTMFNQAFFVCDWWYNTDCQSAPYLYFLNERIFDVPEVDETAPHRTLTAEVLDTIFV